MPNIVLSQSTASLLEIGTTGLQRGIRQAEQAASDIALTVTAQPPEETDSSSTNDGRSDASSDSSRNSNDTTVSLSEAAVDLIQAKSQVQASAQLVSTADELVSTLIDTIA